MILDPLYIIMIAPAVLLALYAQAKVKSAYAKWSRVNNSHGFSGAEAASEMLRREGIYDVRIEPTQGWLSDHYDPSSKTLRLSRDVYGGRSVTAVGIAAHEAGHAIQHAHSYALLGLRTAIVPVASLGSGLAGPLIMIGFLLMMFTGGPSALAMLVVKAGIILFAGVVLFQLVTLPVEFDASSRAKHALVANNVIGQQQEVEGVSNVLNAAALTYVAAALSAVMQLLYFLLRFGMLGGDE